MHILGKLPSRKTSVELLARNKCPEQRMRTSVIDAMVEVQSLDKPEQIRNCSHLADRFFSLIFEKYGDSDDTRLIFDRYDIPSSLKQATHLKREGQQDLINFRIIPSTLITKVTIKSSFPILKQRMSWQ